MSLSKGPGPGRSGNVVIKGLKYSGFHLDPELASRDEGAPREERTRGAVGGIVPIVTTSRHKPFSEFKNIGFSGVIIRPLWAVK
jgi:hypothetical protein